MNLGNTLVRIDKTEMIHRRPTDSLLGFWQHLMLIPLIWLFGCGGSNTPDSTLPIQTIQESENNSFQGSDDSQVEVADAVGVLNISADGEFLPSFRVDPFWGSEMPDNWILGEVAGLSVDAQDHVWIVHRPRTLDARQRGEEGMCCIPAPPVIEFSASGSVLRSWGGPGDGFDWPENEHGIHVDYEGHVWIGGNGPSDSHILKFTADGDFLLQIGRAGQGVGSNDKENLGRPAAIEVDPHTNEVYVADGYRNRRLVVFDAITGQYKRHWGAYGEQPSDLEPSPYTPAAAPARQFRTPVHDVTLANDGLVYVADRTSNRLQVFQKDGTFQTEAFVRPATLGSGSVSALVLSDDSEQRWLFIADGTNNVIWIVERQSLEVQSHFGRLGKNAGQFYRLHNLDIDSRGNLYTTEVNAGQRVQKFERLNFLAKFR